MDKPKHFLSAGQGYLKCCNAAFPASVNDFRWSSLQSHREKQILTSAPVSPPHSWMPLQTMQYPRTHTTLSMLNTTLSQAAVFYSWDDYSFKKGHDLARLPASGGRTRTRVHTALRFHLCNKASGNGTETTGGWGKTKRRSELVLLEDWQFRWADLSLVLFSKAYMRSLRKNLFTLWYIVDITWQ